MFRGIWVAQSVKCPTLDFGTWFLRWNPALGFTMTVWILVGILSPTLSLSAPPLVVPVHALFQNKETLKKETIMFSKYISL